MIVRLFTFALILVILSSCSAVDSAIPSRVNTINQSTEEALNDGILTNIVRASQYRPLNFIGISKISGGQTLDLTNGLPTITFGPNQTPLQHQFIFSNNSMRNGVTGSIDVSTIATKDFYKGLLTPLSMVDVNLLLSQGYPRELIFNLMLDSVKINILYDKTGYGKITDAAKLIYAAGYPNDPQIQNKRYDLFARVLDLAIASGITTETRDECNLKFDPNDKTNAAGARVISGGRICFDEGARVESNNKFFENLLEQNKALRCGTMWARAKLSSTLKTKIERKPGETKNTTENARKPNEQGTVTEKNGSKTFKKSTETNSFKSEGGVTQTENSKEEYSEKTIEKKEEHKTEEKEKEQGETDKLERKPERKVQQVSITTESDSMCKMSDKSPLSGFDLTLNMAILIELGKIDPQIGLTRISEVINYIKLFGSTDVKLAIAIVENINDSELRNILQNSNFNDFIEYYKENKRNINSSAITIIDNAFSRIRAEIFVNIRSTYAIFNYMGKILIPNSRNPLVAGSNLVVIRSDQVDGCFSQINYDGENYCVPREATNTKIAFAILSQLLALKTSPGDLPITPSVRITP
jgi:hypothetical protein